MTVVCPPDGTHASLPSRQFFGPVRRLPRPAQKSAGAGALMRSSSAAGRPPQRYHWPMEPPGITRHRRPFLVPLYGSVLLAVVLFALGWALYSNATTTLVFLV